MSAGQSCMSPSLPYRRDAGDPHQTGDKGAPASALARQHLLAGGRQTIEAAPPLALAHQPAADDEAAAFEAVEGGIERRDVKLDGAVGSRLDELREFVAVPGLLREQRQDHDLDTA